MTQPSEPRTAPLHSPLGRIALNAIRWRSGQPNIACAMLEGDVRWLLRYLDEAEAAAPDPVASPNEAVNAAIRTLRDLSPDAEWIEKFYAALEAMAWLATGHELVAEGTPPHVVMARFIDDLAWRTVASPPEAVELLRELVALLDESGYPEWVDLDAAEDTLAEARRFLEGPVASPLNVQRLARALIDSDLMPRYREYAMRVPTMDPSETVEHLAAVWAGWVAAAYAAEGQPAAQDSDAP